MSFPGQLTHRLAVVTPTITGDAELAADLDDYGNPTEGTPTVELVWGLVQPKSAREVALISQAGAEISDHTIFLLPRRLSNGSWLADADASGVLSGGRRFDVVGVHSFEYGTRHLEVDARLVGPTEGPSVAGS